MAVSARSQTSLNSFGVTTNEDDQSPKLVSEITWKNWLTLGMYIANCGVTYVSISGAFGKTNTELSRKYQTLITPAGWAFSIWGPIFIWEGIFAVTQLLPSFRCLDSVQSIAPWWWASCVFQIFWSITFAAEGISLAFLLMLSILVSLLGALWMGDSKPGSVAEYWLIRAPLSLQCGWIVAASALNFSVFATAREASQVTLLTYAIASLGGIVAIAALAAFAVPMPNPIVCFVAFWALMGIYSELGDAKLMKDTNRFNYLEFPQVVFDGVRGASIILAIVSLALMFVAAVRRSKVLPFHTKPTEVTSTFKDAPLIGA